MALSWTIGKAAAPAIGLALVLGVSVLPAGAQEAAPAQPVSCGQCHGTHSQSLAAAHQGLTPRFEQCLDCHTAGEAPDHKPAIHEFEHGPFAARECSICHESAGESDAPTVPEKTAELCVVCHSDIEERVDESAVTHGALQLTESCHNCHSPHATPNRHQLLEPTPDLCLSCHVDIRLEAASRKHHHRPAFEGGCEICHDPHASDQPKLLRTDVNSLCLECHAKPVDPEAESVARFDGRVVLPAKFFEGMTLVLPDPGAEKGHPWPGHPVRGTEAPEALGGGEVSCVTCHRPHAANGKKLLVTEKKGTSALCVTCH